MSDELSKYSIDSIMEATEESSESLDEDLLEVEKLQEMEKLLLKLDFQI